MIIRKAFKFRLDATPDQQARLRVLCGHARFVWNAALERCELAYRTDGEYVPRYETMAKWVTAWKRETETLFLSEAYTDNLQQKLKDLDSAWRRYFDPKLDAEKPRFKKKGRDADSIRFVNFNKYCQLTGRRVKLPSSLGWCRFRKSREISGVVKNCTVSFRHGYWWISFQTEQTVEPPAHRHPDRWIGIDAGIARFATFDNGCFIAPLNSFRRHEARLRKAQQALSRKTKFSANWIKSKQRVHRIHSQIANARKDYLHKISTDISYNHAMIVIEDLKVKNLSASASGTREEPGKNVKAKSGLNKSILDQGWGEFRRQLEYKSVWSGGQVLPVPPHHTSQTCPICRHVSSDNRRSQADFLCTECGYSDNADTVGAMNILARGIEIRAKGGTLPGSPVK